MGSLRVEMVLKPTISLKYNVTSLKCSGSTGLPSFSDWATDLQEDYCLLSETFVIFNCYVESAQFDLLLHKKKYMKI